MPNASKPLPKLTVPSDEEIDFQYPQIYVREKTKTSERLVITASHGGVQLMLDLATALEGQFSILYVLVVPRSSEPGRYQSPWMNSLDVQVFMYENEAFLEQDGRHHVWLYSDSEKATLVYDQHNVIFAYGPLEKYIEILKHKNYAKALPEQLKFPAPHGHHYHKNFDQSEYAITGAKDWIRTPLMPQDTYS